MATTRIQIGPADQGRKMTLEEFREADEEPGSLYELARGVLDVVEIPGDDHGQIVHNLHEALSHYHAAHPGTILRIGHGSDIRVIVTEMESDRHPDLGVVLRDAPRDERGRRKPTLVIELVSSGKAAHKRDYVEKREEYLVQGIPEYWIVDPQTRQVTVLNRVEGPAWAEQVFQANDAIASATLPGFAATVDELWNDAGIEETEES